MRTPATPRPDPAPAPGGRRKATFTRSRCSKVAFLPLPGPRVGSPRARVPTFPMLVGGRLRRAEAGRGRPVHDAGGALVGHATAASPADVADAVAAARAALPGWSGAEAHERGRVLHDVAELLAQRVDRLAAAGADPADARAAADRWLWYAGWTDKIDGLLGAAHPVAGPYASWSAPRPVGVVGVLAPASLLGLVDALAAVLAAGATAVVVAPHRPRGARRARRAARHRPSCPRARRTCSPATSPSSLRRWPARASTGSIPRRHAGRRAPPGVRVLPGPGDRRGRPAAGLDRRHDRVAPRRPLSRAAAAS